jgi:flagellar operon protein (TIGR03826 family)
MADLANCSRCGNLFVKTTRDICQDCFKEEERQFEIVYNFMKKRANRQATIPEIVEATGVKEDLIIKFVKEKRLRSAQFPNLTYNCERCGKQINEGKLCQSCSAELSGDLKHQHDVEQVKKMHEQREKEKANQTYVAVDKGRNDRKF